MSRLAAALGLFCLFALVATAAVQAAPQDISRSPDVKLEACNGPTASCLLRGIGDFDGDEIDDLLFERADMPGVRIVELVLGPVAPTSDDSAVALVPASSFSVVFTGHQLPLAVDDVNGDGLDDVLLFSASQTPQFEGFKLVVVLGRTVWPASLNAGSSVAGDMVFERSYRLPYWSQNGARTRVPTLTAALADVNGDGKPDVIFGRNGTELASGNSTVIGSQIDIMFATGPWARRTDFRANVSIVEMGACGTGLAGVADVTGDGIPDIVARRCAGRGMPDQLAVVEGRTQWGPRVSLAVTPSRATDDAGRAIPVPPRGYVPSEGPSSLTGPSFFLEDMNADGIDDILFEFSDKTHVWLGGPDVAERVAANRSSRVLVRAGYGAIGLTGAWGPADLDGDGATDLVVAEQPPSLASAPKDRHGREPRVGPTDGVTPLRIYKDGWTRRAVIDVAHDAPDAIWDISSYMIWGMGDLNGDGQTDIVVGNSPPSARGDFGVLLGPVVADGPQ